VYDAAAVALYFIYCEFGRQLQAVRVTPAIEAGVADRVLSVDEIVGLHRTLGSICRLPAQPVD
jgi:hypothetical protein